MMEAIHPNLSLLKKSICKTWMRVKVLLLTILFGTTSIDIYLSWKATIAVLTG